MAPSLCAGSLLLALALLSPGCIGDCDREFIVSIGDDVADEKKARVILNETDVAQHPVLRKHLDAAISNGSSYTNECAETDQLWADWQALFGSRPIEWHVTYRDVPLNVGLSVQ